MTINENRSFKAIIAKPDGSILKERVNIRDGVVNIDYGVKVSLFVLILLTISIIGIAIYEIANSKKLNLQRLFALNEVKAMRVVNTKILPNDKKERKAFAFAIGYNQICLIATDMENEFSHYIFEQHYDELEYEEYKKLKDNYDKNQAVMKEYVKHTGPIILFIIILIILVAVFVPLIISLSQQTGL